MDKEHQQQQRSSLHLDSFAPLDGEPDQEHVVAGGGGGEMVDYMLGQPPPATPGPQRQVSFDKLTFSDVLQFADFGPKLALNQPAPPSEHHHDGGDEDDDDDSYFLRFQSLPSLPAVPANPARHAEQEEGSKTTVDGGGGGVSESTTSLVQQSQQQQHDHHQGSKKGEQGAGSKSGRRKRPRSVKTNEEVESQRMTHIAVERNRRRQMNDYLRVLRSLMPGSYVQRGDQASIIGGAIEFIRELEQLIQCLESQKRRRLYGGDAPRPVADGAAMQQQSQAQAPPAAPAPPFFAPTLPFPASSGGSGDGAAAGAKVLDLDAGGGDGDIREEVVENKSILADIEVRVLGEDAMIKILSRRRPGQLIKIIAALEEMHMSIIHTNITTIELTVLYSFNVKVAGEARYSAEDIAGAVHQILSFIDVNYAL